MRKNIDYYLYILAAKRFTKRGKSRVEFLKIGHSATYEKRIKAIDYATPMNVKLVSLLKSKNKNDILNIENFFKKNMIFENFKGEWYLVYDDKHFDWYLKKIAEFVRDGVTWA